MVIFYKRWKKNNEIQSTKNKMGLNNRRMTNHPPSPEIKKWSIKITISSVSGVVLWDSWWEDNLSLKYDDNYGYSCWKPLIKQSNHKLSKKFGSFGYNLWVIFVLSCEHTQS